MKRRLAAGMRPELIGRRSVIMMLGGAAVASPLRARAQKTSGPVIGYIFAGTTEGAAPLLPEFRKGLAEKGFVEGRNISIEYRIAEGHFERLPGFAADLVERGVNLIMAIGGFAPAKAAEDATHTIPIVFSTGEDAVTQGLVASYNRPGGNATGMAIMITPLVAKRVELLHKMVPESARIGLLLNPKYPDGGAEDAARRIGLEPIVVHAETEGQLDTAFATLIERKVGSVLVGTDPAISGWNRSTVALAARYALPAIYNFRFEVVNGALMSYGPDIADAYHQCGIYAGRILKGEKPADLPVLQPTKFDLEINLKTAKALGLAVPPTLLALADGVIE